jgi:hypothetical protein
MNRPQARWRGGLLAVIGFLLSPLSWWNDLFVNIPLALGFAWLIGLAWPTAFEASFVVGYWLTNVAGLVLLTRGAKTALAGRPAPLYLVIGVSLFWPCSFGRSFCLARCRREAATSRRRRSRVRRRPWTRSPLVA